MAQLSCECTDSDGTILAETGCACEDTILAQTMCDCLDADGNVLAEGATCPCEAAQTFA